MIGCIAAGNFVVVDVVEMIRDESSFGIYKFTRIPDFLSTMNVPFSVLLY